MSSHCDLIQYELYHNKSHYYYHLIAVIVLIDKNHLIVNGSLIYEHIYMFLSIHVIQDIKKFWEIIFLLLQQLYFLINVVWSECVVISNNFFSQHSKENNILYTLFLNCWVSNKFEINCLIIQRTRTICRNLYYCKERIQIAGELYTMCAVRNSCDASVNNPLRCLI